LHIREFWESKDYVERLIVALNHPEKETPLHAALLLGRLKDVRAVQPLIELINRGSDVYIVREAVHALGEINTTESREFLGTLANHRAKMVRDEVKRIISKQHKPPPILKKERNNHE
jgi:HEAT repeat protein